VSLKERTGSSQYELQDSLKRSKRNRSCESPAKNYDTLRQFLDKLLQSRSDLQNERFVSHAIVLYGQANMMNQALDTFKFMRENLNIVASVKSLNTLLLAAILAKNHKE
jgi:hypothetical protein